MQLFSGAPDEQPCHGCFVAGSMQQIMESDDMRLC
jgi:hypothetical protein